MTFVIGMSSGKAPIAHRAQRPHRGRMDINDTPALRTKLIFWMFLGFLSVAIAEVTVSSSPLAFVNPVETAFLTLFYGSHLLVFAWLAFRKGWPTLSTLWFAGVLFGLYEFYITKVLWAPPWGDTISMAHIDVVALIVLAFFWHPFMAFIFPLAIGEAAGTTSRRVGQQLPRWLAGASLHMIGVGAAIAAATFGLMTGSPAMAGTSSVSALTAVVLAGKWWRRADRHIRWDLRELLPTDRQGKGIAALLALQYIIFIPLWNPESIPPLLGHLVVWLLYGGFALLLRSSLQESDPGAAGAWAPIRFWARRRMAKWVTLLVLLAMIASLGPPELGFIVVWLTAVVAGLRMLVGSLRRSLRIRPSEGRLRASRAVGPDHRS